MFLEIGESFGASWLRYVKECPLVHENWRPRWDDNIVKNPKIDKLIEVIKHSIDKKWNVLNNYKTRKQLISKTECDLLGLLPSKQSFCAVEVAMHSDGLHYTGKDSRGKRFNASVGKVISKMVRIALAMIATLKIAKGEIYFMTPYSKQTVEDEVDERIKTISSIFAQEHVSFHFVTNDAFSRELEKLIDRAPTKVPVADVFLRVIQLYRLSKEFRPWEDRRR